MDHVVCTYRGAAAPRRGPLAVGALQARENIHTNIRTNIHTLEGRYGFLRWFVGSMCTYRGAAAPRRGPLAAGALQAREKLSGGTAVWVGTAKQTVW